MEVTLPAGLATLEKALNENKHKSGFFVGKKVIILLYLFEVEWGVHSLWLTELS